MITLDYKDRRPIYIQLVEKIEDLARHGIIKVDEQLPSVRSLAVELSINPNTIQRAYGELEHRGVTYSVAGKGSFLAANQSALMAEGKMQTFKELEALLQKSVDFGATEDEVCVIVKNVFNGGGSK